MRRSTFVAAGAALILATGASAQNPRPDTAIALPGMTVTAARVPLRVLDVPLAVTFVGRDQLWNRSGTSLDQAFFSIPGALAQSRYGGTDIRIVIRGFGARGAGDRSNAGTTRGVRILQDGFPETEPDGRTSMDLLDLGTTQSLEVIRSNASALWGNAAGGLVNFSTVPGISEKYAAFEQTSGSFGLTREVVRGALPLGDNAQVYGTAIWSEFDGWRANSQGDRKLFNLGVVAHPGARTELRATAVGADNKFNIPGPLTLAQLEANPEQANATYLSRFERRRNRVGRIGLSLDHGIGADNALSAMIFVNPKYLQRSERGTFRDFTRYHVGGNAMYRMATNFSSDVTGSLMVGVDEAYQDGAILFYGLTTAGGRATDLRDNKREGANNLGLFAQQMITFSPKFDVSVGGRYDDISYYSDSYINPTLNAKKSFTRVTPKVGVAYHLKRDQTIYANLGGGVEAPAGNETDPVQGTADTIFAINPLLEPISSTSIEAGIKQLFSRTDGFFRAVSYDIALYHTGVTNEIVPYRGGRFYFTAAKAERMGAEFGARVATAPGVSLTGALTIADNRYRDYVVDSVHYGKPGAKADYSDNKVVGVPDAFFNIGATYAPSFFQSLQGRLELQNSGEYYADDANLVRVKGYSIMNASIDLIRPIDLGAGLNVRGFFRVENLTDRKYVASAFLNPDLVSGSPAAFEPGLPRHFVVSGSIGWNR